MRRSAILFYIVLATSFSFIIYGCSSSKEHSEKDTVPDSVLVIQENETEEKDAIIKTALIEQDNPMYSPSVDTTFIYWLDNKVSRLKNYTKCNIFALNVLYKSGYKTPDKYALSRDLYNDSLFNNVLPMIKINEPEELITGDLIIWPHHVIIFESLIYKKKKVYANGVWAGTSQKDNGNDVKNNVIFGRYELKKDYKVRRPQKEESKENKSDSLTK